MAPAANVILPRSHSRVSEYRSRSLVNGCGCHTWPVRSSNIGSPVAGSSDTVALLSLSMPWCRSEEHTSELQSLMRISYAVFCLKKKTKIIEYTTHMQTKNQHTHTVRNTTAIH